MIVTFIKMKVLASFWLRVEFIESVFSMMLIPGEIRTIIQRV